MATNLDKASLHGEKHDAQTRWKIAPASAGGVDGRIIASAGASHR